MNQKYLIGWAIATTALSLFLLGILVGRSTGDEGTAATAEGAYARFDTDTSLPAANVEAAAPAVIVPAGFDGLPREWRTDPDKETFDGYAIWFDPRRGEVIVEQCLHRGYLTEDGAPLTTKYEFCEGVLWASILDMSDTGATVRTRTGEIAELNLELAEGADQETLSLSFPGHEMVLIPGSKNDLLQAMDNTPRMIREKQQQFEAFQAQYRERERAREAGTSEGEREIPTYTLPAGVEQGDGTD